jgi:hypothetical protein
MGAAASMMNIARVATIVSQGWLRISAPRGSSFVTTLLEVACMLSDSVDTVGLRPSSSYIKWLMLILNSSVEFKYIS